jgi:hypothetical protein
MSHSAAGQSVSTVGNLLQRIFVNLHAVTSEPLSQQQPHRLSAEPLPCQRSSTARGWESGISLRLPSAIFVPHFNVVLMMRGVDLVISMALPSQSQPCESLHSWQRYSFLRASTSRCSLPSSRSCLWSGGLLVSPALPPPTSLRGSKTWYRRVLATPRDRLVLVEFSISYSQAR